jgi:alpha/beta superfamily hydrolase
MDETSQKLIKVFIIRRTLSDRKYVKLQQSIIYDARHFYVCLLEEVAGVIATRVTEYHHFLSVLQQSNKYAHLQ